MFVLLFKPKFLRKAKKFLKNNSELQKRLQILFEILEEDPFYSSLKTHKVHDINGEKNYSSSLSPDLRVIWNFKNGKPEIIDILDIGGHSGGKKVYQ